MPTSFGRVATYNEFTSKFDIYYGDVCVELACSCFACCPDFCGFKKKRKSLFRPWYFDEYDVITEKEYKWLLDHHKCV